MGVTNRINPSPELAREIVHVEAIYKCLKNLKRTRIDQDQKPNVSRYELLTVMVNHFCIKYFLFSSRISFDGLKFDVERSLRSETRTAS